MKKFPKYKGCLTQLYMPWVFKTSATWPSLVFLPDVPGGTWPMVFARMATPRKPTAQQKAW
jgi:hypothetical protein